MGAIRGTNTLHGLVRWQKANRVKVGKRLYTKTYDYLFVQSPIASKAAEMVSGLTSMWRVTLSRIYGTDTRNDAVFIRVLKSDTDGRSNEHKTLVFRKAKDANTFFNQMRHRLSGRYMGSLPLNELMANCRRKNPRWF